MRALISEIGMKLMQSKTASRAVIRAIIDNPIKFASGEGIPVTIINKDGNEEVIIVHQVQSFSRAR